MTQKQPMVSQATLPVSTSPAAMEAGSSRLWDALREVRDPELPVSLVDLGLIYAIRSHGSHVELDLTFTATACPCMDFIREDIRARLLQEPGVETIEIREVWDPPWSADRITPAGREALRRCGVAA